MQTRIPATSAPPRDTASETTTLDGIIRDHVPTYALWHGWRWAARHFGVFRHILWRFLKRGHLGRSLHGAVIKNVGDDPGTIAAG